MKRTLINTLNQLVEETVKIQGWIYTFRKMGKMSFIVIRDRSGMMQVIVPKNILNDINLSDESVI